MLSKNKNKATLATLAFMLLSFSVASLIVIGTPHYARAQGVAVEGGGNATNATMTGAGNATNATMTGAGNATNATMTGAGNATNATMTGAGNATNATMTGAGNATNATSTGAAGGPTSVSIVPGSSSLTTDAYQPNPVQVSTGATVTWTNDDAQPHTATSGENATPDGTFDSGIMAPAATFEHTFATAGEYPYYCILHPNMVGTVSVS
jgi:plastocyanin